MPEKRKTAKPEKLDKRDLEQHRFGVILENVEAKFDYLAEGQEAIVERMDKSERENKEEHKEMNSKIDLLAESHGELAESQRELTKSQRELTKSQRELTKSQREIVGRFDKSEKKEEEGHKNINYKLNMLIEDMGDIKKLEKRVVNLEKIAKKN
jgi:small-conductance mechanosensitive channel